MLKYSLDAFEQSKKDNSNQITIYILHQFPLKNSISVKKTCRNDLKKTVSYQLNNFMCNVYGSHNIMSLFLTFNQMKTDRN